MNLINNINPLVSIIVITYNSSKFVLETLESVRNQTYQNIELIISDDCSMDDTVEVCENWIKNNHNRFIRTEIITSNENKGISQNCNKGIGVARGEWIKLIAGDDILIETCLSQYITFIDNNDFNFIFSKTDFIYPKDYMGIFKMKDHFENNYSKFNVSNQYLELLKFNFVPAATSFINLKKLKELGGFNENFPMMEDHPLWIKITKSGERLGFMNEYTTKYRIHGLSMSGNLGSKSNSNQQIINKIYYQSVRKFNLELITNDLLEHGLYSKAYTKLLFIFESDITLLLGNKTNILTKILKKVFVLLNPFTWKYYFQSQ